jgi:hypothetical protein
MLGLEENKELIRRYTHAVFDEGDGDQVAPAEALVHHAPKYLRVALCHHGPPCSAIPPSGHMPNRGSVSSSGWDDIHVKLRVLRRRAGKC